MKLTYFFALLLGVFIKSSNVVNAETLKNALLKAYQHSEMVGIQDNKKDFGKIDRDTAILAFLPTLTASYQYNKVLKKHQAGGENPMGTQIGNLKKTHVASVGITSSLALYKTIPGLYVAIKGKQAKDSEFNDFLESFGMLFIQTYMDVIYNINALQVYNQMSDILEKKLKKVSVLNQSGIAKKDKVVLAEAQFYENKASEIRTRSTLDKVKMDYKIMTGEDPINLELPKMDNLKLPAANKEDFVANVLKNNSKIKQVVNESISQKHYAVIKSLDILPEVFTETSYMYYNLPGFLNIGALYTGIGITWKINDGTNRFGTARKEYKSYRIADLNRSLTIKQTEQDASYAWDQYFAMLELVKATEKALKASRDSLKEVKVSVSTGTATFIDEMDVENQYLNANLNYLNAQKSLILAYYKMISMTGVGYLPVCE